MYLFHKCLRQFSSQLNIYKSIFLWYNITCRWTIVCRVPLFCTSLLASRNVNLMTSLRAGICGCAIFIKIALARRYIYLIRNERSFYGILKVFGIHPNPCGRFLFLHHHPFGQRNPVHDHFPGLLLVH